MTTNENTIEYIKYEAKSFCEIVDCFAEACQQEEAYGGREGAPKARLQYKREMLAKWDEVLALIRRLDSKTK